MNTQFMNMRIVQFIILYTLSICAVCSLMYALLADTSPITLERTVSTAVNVIIVVHCEIPVLDMERASRFYNAVLGINFTYETIDGNEMALSPFGNNAIGASCALAKGEIYKPSTTGTLVYLQTPNIDVLLHKVIQMGGKVLYPKTSVGNNSFVAEFLDSEGNRIALLSKK